MRNGASPAVWWTRAGYIRGASYEARVACMLLALHVSNLALDD